MIIDLNAEAAAKGQLPVDAKLDSRSPYERSSSNSLEYSHSELVIEPASPENPSIYPRELTQIPAYIDHLPAKKIKSAFSSLVMESLHLMMEKSPRTGGLRSEKIIDAGFGTIASDLFSKAA